jgi:fructose PTS system EIIB component
VETQGAMGIENELDQEDIANADGVIFAVDIAVQKKERFDGLKIVEVSVQEAIKNPEGVLQKIAG